MESASSTQAGLALPTPRKRARVNFGLKRIFILAPLFVPYVGKGLAFARLLVVDVSRIGVTYRVRKPFQKMYSDSCSSPASLNDGGIHRVGSALRP